MRSRVLAVVGIAGVTALLAGTASAATAAPTKTTPFKATYAGRAIVQATGDTAKLSAKGAGVGTLVKASKLVGLGIGANSTPCPVFSGTGTITSAVGTIRFKVNAGATACAGATESDPNVLKGVVVVTGGTGTFKKAKGTLKLSGTYSRATGKFSATFAGPLST